MVMVDEFRQQVFDAVERSPLCDNAVITLWEKRRIKIHVDLYVGGFIEAFYNQETDTTAYALVMNEERVLGADNTGGWHYHPFNRPSEHVASSAPVPFAEFLDEVERCLS